MTLNTSVEWTTGNDGEFFGPHEIESTAKHEFGHWVRFVDVFEDEDTIMIEHPDPDLDEIGGDDSDELSVIYGE